MYPPSATGLHLLLELHGCDPALLNDVARVRAALFACVEAVGATPVGEVFHAFSPQGVTGVVVVEESHFSVHTWPEHGYAAVDVFTCGACDPMRAVPAAMAGLQATRGEIARVRRGLGGERSIEVEAQHRVPRDPPAP